MGVNCWYTLSVNLEQETVGLAWLGLNLVVGPAGTSGKGLASLSVNNRGQLLAV
jgi:hypothetical protein